MSDARLHWVDLAGGRVTAAGAPGPGRLHQWAAQGATDVLTLQRADEHHPMLPAWCAAEGLGWGHLPLSGRSLQRASDRDALQRVATIGPTMAGRSLVVHCAAGLHRTGVCLYLLLRHDGASPEAAMARIAEARPLTAEELWKRTRKHGVLAERAEAIFQATAGPAGR